MCLLLVILLVLVLTLHDLQVIGYTLCFGLMGALAVQTCMWPVVSPHALVAHCFQISILPDSQMTREPSRFWVITMANRHGAATDSSQ